MDGPRQRRALTAAETAVRFLAAGDATRATQSAATAARLDQIGLYSDLEDAVRRAVADGKAGTPLHRDAWASVRAALPPGPLQSLVDSLSS
jgi:2-methylisocitrate lyase-like PEP mutase family enzyme